MSIHHGADLVGVDRLRKDRDFVDIRPGYRRFEGERPIRRNREAVASVVLQDYARVSDEPGNHPTDRGAHWIRCACDGDGDVGGDSAAARARVDSASLRRIARLCLNGYRVRAVLGDGGRERKGAVPSDRKLVRVIIQQNEPGARKPADRYAYGVRTSAAPCAGLWQAAASGESNRDYGQAYKKERLCGGLHGDGLLLCCFTAPTRLQTSSLCFASLQPSNLIRRGLVIVFKNGLSAEFQPEW